MRFLRHVLATAALSSLALVAGVSGTICVFPNAAAAPIGADILQSPSRESRSAAAVGDDAALTEKQVHDWLMQHPDFLLRNLDVLERAQTLANKRAAEAERVRLRDIIAAHVDLLSRIASVTGMGESGGETILAFVDYECLPCRADAPILEAFVEKHSNWRIIELPLGILSATSAAAVEAVFDAPVNTGRLLHARFMRAPLPLSYSAVRGAPEYATSHSFAPPASKQSTSQEIRSFAEVLGVTGAPAYVIRCVLQRGRFDATRALASDACP